MALGKQIKEKRKKDKLTAEELGVLLGVPMNRIYKWERGAKPSDAQDLININNWLAGKLETGPKEKAIDLNSEAMAKQILQAIAFVKTFRSRLAKLEARVLQMDEGDVLDSIDADTRINLKDLQNELQ